MNMRLPIYNMEMEGKKEGEVTIYTALDGPKTLSECEESFEKYSSPRPCG